MTARHTRSALAALVLILALTACSAAPSEHAAEPTAETGHGESSESGHEVSADEGPAAYPPGYPVEQVPVTDGELLHVAHPGNVWAAWIASDDLVGDLFSAVALLVDAGYTVTTQADGYADLTHPDRVLRIVASVDATWGSSLQYTFTDGATEVEGANESTDGSDAESSH
jgi:hypothetical protein